MFGFSAFSEAPFSATPTIFIFSIVEGLTALDNSTQTTTYSINITEDIVKDTDLTTLGSFLFAITENSTPAALSVVSLGIESTIIENIDAGTITDVNAGFITFRQDGVGVDDTLNAKTDFNIIAVEETNLNLDQTENVFFVTVVIENTGLSKSDNTITEYNAVLTETVTDEVSYYIRGWVSIVGEQNPDWVLVNDTQTDTWVSVDTTQIDTWVDVDDSQ